MFELFSDVISVSNGNHMLNANTTSSMSAPSGSCDAVAPLNSLTHSLTHTHTPSHHPQPLMSPLLFPTVSHLLHREPFCFTYIVSFCFPPLFCACSCSVIQTDTLTLQASYDSLVSSALCFNPLPDVASIGTDLVVVKTLCDDYIDLHLWLISCFTVTVPQH